MQSRSRSSAPDLKKPYAAPILLTSHYMDDIVALCKRVIVIHHGKLLYDGALADLAERMAPYKVVGATLRDGAARADLSRYGEVASNDAAGRVKLRVPRTQAPGPTAR